MTAGVRRLFALAVCAATGTAAFDAAADANDAGAPAESTHGCVESIPKGARRPAMTETFPVRGVSGYAAVLSMRIQHGKGEHVLPAGLDLSNATDAKHLLEQQGFAIPDQDGGARAEVRTTTEANSENVVTEFELPLLLLPSEPGRRVMHLPSLPVAVARANGELMTVCTRQHTITVDDPIANVSEPTPKGNPPPQPQREDWQTLRRAVLWGALGVAIGSLLAYAAYRLLTRPKPPPPPPPPRAPWEIALERLDEVRHAGLLDVHRYGEYYDRVSDAVRGYLGARFGFDGLESTTDEILTALEKNGAGFVHHAGGDGGPLPGVDLAEVGRFLRECDLVKFANLTPTPDQCAGALEAGEQLVRATMPAVLPPSIAPPTPSKAPPASPSKPPPASSPGPFAPPPTLPLDLDVGRDSNTVVDRFPSFATTVAGNTGRPDLETPIAAPSVDEPRPDSRPTVPRPIEEPRPDSRPTVPRPIDDASLGSDATVRTAHDDDGPFGTPVRTADGEPAAGDVGPPSSPKTPPDPPSRRASPTTELVGEVDRPATISEPGEVQRPTEPASVSEPDAKPAESSPSDPDGDRT